MPLPRSKDDGTGGAPVLNLGNARVKLVDVEEFDKPYTRTRKSDGAEFTFDPCFEVTVEIVNDGKDGADNGTTFFEKFKYKNAKKDKTGEWSNKQNSKLGALTEVVKTGYFEDDSIADLDASDLEGFEMLCRVKPSKNPSTGAIVGSTIDWETMQRVPTPEKVTATTAAWATEEEEAFDDIPF
jgi:hypothetical protein